MSLSASAGSPASIADGVPSAVSARGAAPAAADRGAVTGETPQVPSPRPTPGGAIAPSAPTAPHPALLDAASPEWQQQAPATFRAEFETTKGLFVIEVVRAWAPIGADRFYNLVRLGYFDDSRFYRIVSRRWAQFGISGVPAVATALRAARIPDDLPQRPNRRGYVSFAMGGAADRTTQVFINLSDNAERLDRQGFAPFGRVIGGMETVVERLYSGYGETSGGGIRNGQQTPLFEGGNAYVDGAYPMLDRLIRARIASP